MEKNYIGIYLIILLIATINVGCGSTEKNYALNLSLKDYAYLITENSVRFDKPTANILLNEIKKRGINPELTIFDAVKKNDKLKFINFTKNEVMPGLNMWGISFKNIPSNKNYTILISQPIRRGNIDFKGIILKDETSLDEDSGYIFEFLAKVVYGVNF